MASTKNRVPLMLLLLLLVLVLALVFLPPAGATGANHGIPSWVNPRLRRLMGGTTTSTAEGRRRMAERQVTVEKDGSGDYTTITAALAAAPEGKTTYTIRVGEGTYVEKLNITRSNVLLLGSGIGKTIITGNQGTKPGGDMPSSATVSAIAPGFMAQDLTIQNTAGPEGNQSVALRCNSQRSVLYRCRLEGFQDTLYAENMLQFYLDCDIAGTVDFIFGNAKAVFQNCRLLVRRPKNPGAHNVITAQGRNRAFDDHSGFSFQNCSVMAMPNDNLQGIETYLGRPWKNYSHVMFMESFLSDIVHPSGWVHWNKAKVELETTRTVSYMEYKNWGPGADTSRRVNWSGFTRVTNASKAAEYTVDRFINGSQWLPEKGIHYKHGL